MATEKSKADTDLEAVTAQANRMKLTGKDRERYIHEHMTRYGYKAKRTYYEPEDDDDNSGGGFFGRRRRSEGDDDDEDE